MGTPSEPRASWVLAAVPSAVAQMRRRAVAFASAAGAPEELTHAVALAVSETVTNVVIHAYDDPALAAWLREALPPARPGTATWGALREGGASLVVHDPAVPRAPGGTGDRLGLTWWLAIALEGPGGEPAALWGLGGREGGRPVPSQAVIRALADASRTGLAEHAKRAALRARLALL